MASNANRKGNEQKRVAEMLITLWQGGRIVVKDLEETYGVDERTVRRDIKAIKAAVLEQRDWSWNHDLVQRGTSRVYAYYLATQDELTYAEVLALLKMVIGVRALSKSEMLTLREHLLSLLSPSHREEARRLTTVTAGTYRPVGYNAKVWPAEETQPHIGASTMEKLPLLDDIATYIQADKWIRFKYQNSKGAVNTIVGKPTSVTFSAHYFYVWIYTHQQGSEQVYRLDRMESDSLRAAHRAEQPMNTNEGDRLNQTYLLGNELTSEPYEIQYWGWPQTALDSLPGVKKVRRATAAEERHHPKGTKILKTNPTSVIISGTGQMQGLVLWIMGQGALVRVVKSPKLRAAVLTEIDRMRALH